MTTDRQQVAGRSGRYITQLGGYRAFVPTPLPPSPPIRIEDDLLVLLSRADQALGRLDASADLLPNPDLFVRMYVRKEAVLSSQIEGTQASLSDLLEYEAGQVRRRLPADVTEVINYVAAMNHGLDRLKDMPLSNRLIREIHGKLLHGARGGEKSPGEFRRTQNWIGPQASTISTASFIPPPPHEADKAMGDLERFMQSAVSLPVLIKIGLIHGQFETIHPFLDGNGRMGRLLITFFLCEQGVLNRPLLYLSAYFKQYRDEYYERLQAVRDMGDWESWLKFFLAAVAHTGREAADTAHHILKLREEHRREIQKEIRGSAYGLQLLDYLFEHPYLTVGVAAKQLAVSYPTANGIIETLKDRGLLEEITGQERNRIFRYAPYLNLLDSGLGNLAPTKSEGTSKTDGAKKRTQSTPD